VELVQSGALGRITRAHCWKTSPTQPAPPTTNPATLPPTLDYDFWLGPAPKWPYQPLRSHISFRYFWDYSGGMFIDFWCHIVDVAVWSLDLKAPSSVDALGGRFFLTDETETPDTLEAVLEYPNLLLTFSFRPTPLTGFEHMGHIGCLFARHELHHPRSVGRWQEGGGFPNSGSDDSRFTGTHPRVSRRDQSAESRDHVQCALRSSRHETGIAGEHRVSHRPADSLERRAGAHRRRQGREPLSAAQVPQGLQAVTVGDGRTVQSVTTLLVRID
jgi:predicted dehydrogenase